MKFKFIGKPDLLLDTLTSNETYEILQFEKRDRYLIVYVIDDIKNLIYIPYKTTFDFNKDWKYMQ